MNPDPSSDDLDDVRTDKRPDLSREDLDYEHTLKGLRPGLKLFGRRYLLRRQLGKGGMGVVWLAEDIRLEVEVALKFLPDMVVHDAAALDDLRQETLRCKSLSHDHVVRVYGLLFEDSMAAIEMEYVDGKNLSELRLEREHRVFEVEEIAVWVKQLCGALTYAHEQAKIVHRDLKPANVMVNGKGMVKVMDFGIAANLGDTLTRLTRVSGGGTKMGGTPPYMSPQQLMGGAPCVSDDVYGLGATIYELLTGKPPFFRGDLVRQIEAVIPPSLAERRRELGVAASGQISQSWEETVAQCLAKEVEARPASASEVSRRLGGDACVGGKAADSPKRVVVPEKERAGQRKSFADSTKGARGWLRKVAMPAGVALAIAMGGGWWFGVEAPRREAREIEAMVKEAELAQAGDQLLVAKLLWERVLEKRPADDRATAGLERLEAVSVDVSVRTEPEGAAIRLGDREPVKAPAILSNVGLGEYPVAIELPGYRRVETLLKVGNGVPVEIVRTLERERGSLKVEILPGDIEATVRCLSSAIDSMEEKRLLRKGVTPLALSDLPSGKYEVTAARKGWPDYKQEIEVTDGAEAAVRHEFAEGSLRIESTPPGQTAVLTAPDEKVVAQGPTPLVVGQLPAGGGYEVMIRREGWPDFRKEGLTIVKGENSPVAWTFAEGSITLASRNSEVNVTLYAPQKAGKKGKMIREGIAPLTIDGLPTGSGYEVKFDWKDRETFVKSDLAIGQGVNPECRHDFPSNELELVTEPPGQKVTVTRNAAGKQSFRVSGETPFTAGELPLGEGYVVSFTREGWPAHQVEVTIGEGKLAPIRHRFPESHLSVELDGMPDSMRGLPVFLEFDRKWQGDAAEVTDFEEGYWTVLPGGRKLWDAESSFVRRLVQLPIQEAPFAPGELGMTIHTPGFLTREESVTLAEGDVQHKIDWDMAKVRIVSDPPGAAVWEADRKIGATPMEIVLPKGKWISYWLAHEGYRSAFVEGIAGLDAELSVALQLHDENRRPFPEFAYFSHFGVEFEYCPPGRMWLGLPEQTEDQSNGSGLRTEHSDVHGFWLAAKTIPVALEGPVSGFLLGADETYVEGAAETLLPTWEQARRYCQVLTRQAHQARAIPTDWAIRLPTEEEWEYGMRRRVLWPGGREWTLSAYRALDDRESVALADLPENQALLRTWRGIDRNWPASDDGKWRFGFFLYRMDPWLWLTGKSTMGFQNQQVDREIRATRGMRLPHTNQAALRPVLAPMVLPETFLAASSAPALALTSDEASLSLKEAWVMLGGPNFSDSPLAVPAGIDTRAARRLFEAVQESSFTSPTQVREAKAGLEALENLGRLGGGALYQFGASGQEPVVVRDDGTVFLPAAGEATKLVGPLGIAFRRGNKWGIMNFAGEIRSAPVWDEILYGASGCFIVRDGQVLRCVHADGDSPLAERTVAASDPSFINPVRSGLNYFDASTSTAYRWMPGEHPVRLPGNKNLRPSDFRTSEEQGRYWSEINPGFVGLRLLMAMRGISETGGHRDEERDEKSGKDVAQPDLAQVLGFFRGFYPASVYVGQHGMGLVTATGRKLVEPEWDFLKGLSLKSEYFAAGKAGKVALLSLGGGVLWPPQFETVELCGANHVFRVQVGGKFGLVDANGGWRLKPEWRAIGNFRELGLEVAVEPGSQGLEALKTVWQGPSVANVVSAENGKAGLVSSEGEILLRPEWDEIEGPIEVGNATRVQWVAKVKRGEKWGLIDSTGHLLLEPDCDVIEVISDGRFRYQKGGLWGASFDNVFSDRIEFGEPKWSELRSVGENLLAGTDGERWGLVARDGRWVGEVRWDEIRDFSNGLAAAKLNGKWGFVDRRGQWSVRPEWDAVGDFSYDLAAVVRGKFVGMVDLRGTLLRVSGAPETGDAPLYWEEVWGFSGGMAKVKRDGKMGLIRLTDRKGGAAFVSDRLELVIECRFDEVEPIGATGFIEVTAGGNKGLYYGDQPLVDPVTQPGWKVIGDDLGGARILTRDDPNTGAAAILTHDIDPDTGKLISFDLGSVWEEIKRIGSDDHSMFLAKKGGKWGLLSHHSIKVPGKKSGDVILYPVFDEISKFENNRSALNLSASKKEFKSQDRNYILVKKEGRLGLFNFAGQEVISPMWSEIEGPFVADRVRARLRDQSGNVTLECLYDGDGNVLWSSDEKVLRRSVP